MRAEKQLLLNEIKQKISEEDKLQKNSELEKFTNQIIAKITYNLDKFNYNVIIANMYETYNFLVNFIKKEKNIKNLDFNYKKILICFSPVIPHFANECLENLKLNKEVRWPIFDKNILETDEVKYVIQINGKKRSIITAKKDILENDLFEILKKDKFIEKYINKKEIKKLIFIQNRLMNILTNE